MPKGEPWSTIEKLNKERDLVGIYLSAHPLDDFSIILKSMCNTHPTELDNKEALTKKEEIIMGGIVTGVKSKFTKTGKPCGFVTIEDYDGSGEMAFFGEDWGHWRGMLTEGCIVYIKAKCQQKYSSSYYDFHVSDIQYMQTVKNKLISKFTICIKSSAVDETVVSDLTTIINNSPGKTQLYVQIDDEEHHNSITLRSKNKLVNLSRELVQYVEGHKKMSYHVN